MTTGVLYVGNLPSAGPTFREFGVMRNLRLLTPKLLQPAAHPSRNATAMFRLGVFAILLQFFLGYVVLEALGFPSNVVKLHPATVLVIFCGMWALMTGVPFQQRCRETPGLVLFVVVIPLLAAYGTYFTGFSGAAVYPESYWSAGLLALMLETASPKQKRFLAKLLLAICVFNVFIAIYESFTATEWFPLVLDPDNVDKLTDIEVDFRPNAFFNHPLTASLITSMAVYLLYTMRMRVIFAAPMFGILLVGLLAYGGRTALGITLIITVLMAFFALFNGIIRRNLKLDFVLVMVAGAIILPIFIALIVTQTSIADRIMDTLYFDGSAAARTTQWEIFKHLTLQNWLFGISHENLSVLKYQIGLGGAETDIENFWFLMLLDLGVIGFAVFLAVFGAFLYHLGRVSRSINGWLLVISSLIIDSGSNSLGVKTSDLFLEVAFVVAMSGYAGYARQPRVALHQIVDRLRPVLRPAGALGDAAGARNRGLRVLASKPF